MPERDDPLRVLLVDDSEAFLAAAGMLVVQQPGLELVGTAPDGRQALAESERLRPDLVLIDAFMPVMDGLEATRRLKRADDAPLVIVISLSDDAALRLESRVAGADAFLSKAELADRLGELVERMAAPDRRAGRLAPRKPPPPSGPKPPRAPAERSLADQGIRQGIWRRLLRELRRDVVCSIRSAAGWTG